MVSNETSKDHAIHSNEDVDHPPPRRKKGSGSVKDAYGFRLNIKGQAKGERTECSTSAQSLLPSWSCVPQGRGLPGSSKLKKMVRKGIPAEYRGSVWMDISGAAGGGL